MANNKGKREETKQKQQMDANTAVLKGTKFWKEEPTQNNYKEHDLKVSQEIAKGTPPAQNTSQQ